MISFVNVKLVKDNIVLLKNINLTFRKGEKVFVFGKTGSGKSTFLKAIYGETEIGSGSLIVNGVDVSKIKSKHKYKLKRNQGMVFQDFILFEEMNVRDNLILAMKATGWKHKDAMLKKIDQVLDQVGMSHKVDSVVDILSGGEKQRLTIARALINNPEILICDEPTGNLDIETAKSIIQLLIDLSDKYESILIITTHNLDLIKQFEVEKILECKNLEMNYIYSNNK